MINNNVSYYLMLTFRVRTLRGELHSFCGTWLRCNFLEWSGAPKRRPRGPAQRGSGSAGDVAIALHTQRGRPHPASGSHLPAEGTAPPCAVAFRVVAPCPAPQKPYTSLRSTIGFRLTQLIKKFWYIRNSNRGICSGDREAITAGKGV